MLRAVVWKELLDGIYGYKFVLTLILAFLVIPFSLYIGAQKYEQELAEYQQAVRDNLEAFRSQTPKAPHFAAHFGMTVNKPPAPLAALSSGVHDILGITTRIDPHRTPQLSGSAYARTPILMLFGTLNFAFVIQVIFSLVALLLASDLIAGEKEDGTLKLTLAHSVSRSAVLLSKLAGGLLVLLIPVLLATVAGLLFFTPPMGIDLNADEWLRVALILLLSLLYLAMMFMLGGLVSTLTHRRITSMVTLLVIWVFLIFIVPRAGASLAQQLYEIPSAQEVDRQIDEVSKEEFEKMVQRRDEILNAHPEYEGKLSPELSVELRRGMDESVEQREGRVQQEVELAKAQQVRRAIALARLSPSTAYVLATTELSGTGVTRHQRFLRYLDDYRRTFSGYFDDMERRDVAEVESFDQVPLFSYREEGVRQILPRTLIDLGLMLSLILLLVAISHFSFLRYDVR